MKYSEDTILLFRCYRMLGYKYIARDKNNTLWAYTQGSISKSEFTGVWCSYESPSGTDCIVPQLSILVGIAPEIKWEDLEPVDIRAALEEHEKGVPKSELGSKAKSMYKASREYNKRATCNCGNCKHTNTLVSEEPCDSCEVMNTVSKIPTNWMHQELVGSGCCNCGHAGVFYQDEPCKSCDLLIKEGKGPTNWIPGRD